MSNAASPRWRRSVFKVNGRRNSKADSSVAHLSNVASSQSSGSTELKSVKPQQHFLPIDSERGNELVRSYHERHRKHRTAKENRKSSILKSLAVLDIDDNDNDYLAKDQYQSTKPFATPSRSTKMSPGQQREKYLRRGSVTKYKLEADNMGMQSSERTAQGGDESDYGSDCHSGMAENDKLRRRYLRRGSVTKYSLDCSSVGGRVQPEAGLKNQSAISTMGKILVGKNRLPPVPTNGAYPVDEEESSTPIIRSRTRQYESKLYRKNSRNSGKPTRRGSMRMPGDEPRPGDDSYSGNLNDSGHHQNHLYFDSPYESMPLNDLSTTLKGGAMSDIASTVNLKVSPETYSARSNSEEFVPLDPKKPRSGRSICVDEAELILHEPEHVNKDHFDTIGTPSFRGYERNSSFSRRESGSSVESDESGTSFWSDNAENSANYNTKISCSSSNKPRLPPAYTSRSTSLTSPFTPTIKARTWSLIPNQSDRNRTSNKNKVSSLESYSKTEAKGDDSTSSSTRSEEDSIYDEKVKDTRIQTPIPRQVRTLRRIANISKFKFVELKDSEKCDCWSNGTANHKHPKLKGCLRGDSKPLSKHREKVVQFGRIVITEFPIILGDNPAVTSGAPVTIDWHPQGERIYSVNAYEKCKPARRRRRKLLIPVSSRAILLLAAGYSIDDIADASINAQQIKFSRQESMQASQYRERVSLLMENTNDAFSGMVQNTGKKLKALITKPVQHSETARTA